MHEKTSINSLHHLIAAEHSRPGFSLSQDFYANPEIFKQDIECIFGRQWLLVDHVSRIPRKGQYFLFEIGNESIIVIRESDTTINAFYNVCRHRGSRICLQAEGKKNVLTCPYHAWTYALDGTLRVARTMPEGFDTADYPLHRCHVKLFHGLILVNLNESEPADFDYLYQPFSPYLQQQGIAEAKIAFRKIYPNVANWKLVVENFLECYHCAPAHPEYSSVHSAEKLMAFGAGPGSGPQEAVRKFQLVQDDWEAKARKLGHFCGIYDPDDDQFALQQADRFPINSRGWLSETLDGNPACKVLMGDFREYDGGQTGVSFNPVSFVLCSNDYAVLFRFTPIDAVNTDIELIWLVHKDAREGTDYDIDHLIRVWDVTTVQDKTITENNQAGILSQSYQPGPYSTQEARNITLKAWYLAHLQANGQG